MLLSLSRVLSVSLLTASLALGACSSGSTAAGSPGTAESAATKGPVAASAPTAPHLKLVATALADVPLRADQRAEIGKLLADAVARHGANRTSRLDLMTALAAQVESGTVDRAALQPKIDAAADAWQASRPADRAAIERLHALLDAGQRAAFVEAFHDAMKSARGEHRGHGDMMKLVADLNLTGDQQDRIRSIMHSTMEAHRGEWKKGHAKGKAVMEAFKSDRFVLDEVAPAAATDARARANEMAGHMLGVVEQVLPILTPEQRTLAAAKIRERAASMADMPGALGE